MARAQGSQASAKEDTRVLILAASITADLSQRLTNLTASGAGSYEAPSTRSILATTRTVSVRYTATGAEVGIVLMICGNAAQTDIVWAIATEGTGRVCAYINGSVGVVTATNVLAAKDYTFSVSTRANPDTTGAGDALTSELIIYNHTDSTLDDIVQAHHAVSAAATGPYNLSIGGWWNGAALTSVPANAVTAARVSSTHHPGPEVLEDWAGARTAYSGLASDGVTEPLGPIPASSGLGDESQWAGRHPWAYASARQLAVRERGWSPVSSVFSDVEDMPPAQQDHWATPAPSDPTYTMDVGWLRWIQVPIETSHLRARVHVRSWVTAGDAVPLGIRVYLLNKPPALAGVGAVQAPALQAFYGEGTLTIDDETGPGQWLDLGPIALPRFEANVGGWTGSIHVAIAYAVDPASISGNDANARFLVDGLQLVPAITGGPWQLIEL